MPIARFACRSPVGAVLRDGVLTHRGDLDPACPGCDLTTASKDTGAGKADADVTSFDGGYGSAYLAKMVGQKAREIFFLGRNYSAQEAFEMGMVNTVIPHAELEDTAYEWAKKF